jgi:hypothetical protein
MGVIDRCEREQEPPNRSPFSRPDNAHDLDGSMLVGKHSEASDDTERVRCEIA